ncbi:G-type lectin S-receptor-like serine/threonine-protein kinase LECRK2 [Senna tora]|uniref:G-type lectin S-receptor-like serine/threonine-protein kinase LECRK2 n=1 Tax=Senna tora TaxID=362788 RepID=A0A834W4I6_9FABA|nr:G-type lectin S-receptor-like serine/threonine-protein kinase LECRK2 [Senna tora]
MAFIPSLFLLFVLLANEVTAQKNHSHIIKLGSRLSPKANSTSWFSASGLFAFGFYQQGNGFAIGIWLIGKPDNTIVWTANRDMPPLSSDSILELNKTGLLLHSENGNQELVTDFSDLAASASMLDSGNFVLYGNNSDVLWQSFDYPTDTILGNQSLFYELVSGMSKSDHSSGHFTLNMQNDGNLVAYPVNSSKWPQDAYWASETSGAMFSQLRLNLEGFLCLWKYGNSFCLVVANSTYLGKNTTIVYRATLDEDGIFRLYEHQIRKNNGSVNQTVVWSSLPSQCDVKGFCGLNSYCSTLNGHAVCQCYPGFLPRKQSNMFLDCKQNYSKDFCETSADKVVPYNVTYLQEEIGRGSSGAVYRGTICGTNRRVAVKKIDKVVDEGEREFQAEIIAIARTHHRNLVQLIGFCIDGSRKLLVYEYMSNGSLSDLLFKAEMRLSWKQRVKIALDVARGILYLHEECEVRIVHCNIKPQNILLDEAWTAKISDFGLARLLNPEHSRTTTGNEVISGYLAPEWQKEASISAKADIYSFGVVLLEIICCRSNIDVNVSSPDEILLSSWVYTCFVRGELNILVADEDVEWKTLERMVKVGLWCVQDNPTLRPSMKNVILMLEGLKDIPIPPSLVLV